MELYIIRFYKTLDKEEYSEAIYNGAVTVDHICAVYKDYTKNGPVLILSTYFSPEGKLQPKKVFKTLGALSAAVEDKYEAMCAGLSDFL